MKYLAILSALLVVALSNFAAEARIGSEKILAHSEAIQEVVDVTRDRSQLAHRELKVCRRVSDERSILIVRLALSLSFPLSLLPTLVSWSHRAFISFVFFILQGDSEFKKRGGADQRAKCSKAKRCYKRKKQCKYNGNRCRHVAQCKRRCNDKC